MRKGQSAIEHLMTYGWMLLVVAIVAGAVFASLEESETSSEAEINPETLKGFLEKETGFENCDIEVDAIEDSATASCTENLPSYNNTTFLNGQQFHVELENESYVVYDQPIQP